MDVEEDKETFLIYDTQGDSKIDSTDIGDVLRALGTNPTQGDVEKIIKEIDPDGTRRISFEEFIPLLHAQQNKTHAAGLGHFIEAFRIYDRDNNETVSAADMRHLLSNLGESLTDEEVDNLLKAYPPAEEDMINYDEFCKKVMEN